MKRVGEHGELRQPQALHIYLDAGQPTLSFVSLSVPCQSPQLNPNRTPERREASTSLFSLEQPALPQDIAHPQPKDFPTLFLVVSIWKNWSFVFDLFFTTVCLSEIGFLCVDLELSMKASPGVKDMYYHWSWWRLYTLENQQFFFQIQAHLSSETWFCFCFLRRNLPQ